MKNLMITCKQATHYISIKEENKLSILDRLKLSMHLMICKFCALFARQNKFIVSQIKNVHPTETLSEMEKESIHKNILENIPPNN